MSRSYRVGESGDQGAISWSGRLTSRLAWPVTRPTYFAAEPGSGRESGIAARTDREAQAAAIEIGGHRELADERGGDGLDPHGLPDAGDGGVPDAVGIEHLLAARIEGGIGGVPDGHDQLLRRGAGLQCAGDVEGERIVAAFVPADRMAVDEDLRLPVHRAEVQQHMRAARVRNGEGAAVPEALVRSDGALDARERRFHGVGNQQLSLELPGPRGIPGA